MFFQVLSIALLSTFETYAAIATGVAMGLSPHIICLVTMTGGLTGIFVTVYLGKKIKALIDQYKKKRAPAAPGKTAHREKLLLHLWHQYGVFGIGFIGTFLVGGILSIGAGMGLGVDSKPLLRWSAAAMVARCVVYSYFFDLVGGLF